jgi:penicillin amidase
MALRWTLYEGSQLFTAIRALNLASNWDEFRAALQDWDIISQNFVYADDQGNIGYQAAGKIPIRVAGHQGIVPVPGWNGEYEWQGFIPAAELPTLFNPPAGFIATANNRAVSSNYPYLIAYDWYNPGYRAQRITELLAEDHDFTMDDMQAIQSQSYSPPAAVLRPYLLAIEPQNERQARALDYVAAWDLQYEPDAVGATIFETWYLSMLDSTVYDEMGAELHGEYAALPTKHVPMLIELMKDPTNPWFDDVSTPAVETRDEIIRRSLENALNWLEDQYRRDFDDLPWGKVHMASFAHVPFGSSGIPPLENLFNSNQVPVSGSRFTVNVTWYSDPFAAEFGTAQRMIIDMANATNGLAINSTGQSEHLFHANREDQITMWRDFAYHAMPLSLAEVKDNTDPVLTLKPQ